jgi:copper chaperone|tara:strand:+ start:330 stop:539 length:210 start_codon:yes stop_codon:yes gene_type:complete
MRSQTIQVGGMSCNHCSQTILCALKAMPGVSNVSVSLKKGEVAVDFDDMQTDTQAISAKIIEVGFEVVV